MKSASKCKNGFWLEIDWSWVWKRGREEGREGGREGEREGGEREY